MSPGHISDLRSYLRMLLSGGGTAPTGGSALTGGTSPTGSTAAGAVVLMVKYRWY